MMTSSTPSRLWSSEVRHLASPVDLSALVSSGVRWQRQEKEPARQLRTSRRSCRFGVRSGLAWSLEGLRAAMRPPPESMGPRRDTMRLSQTRRSSRKGVKHERNPIVFNKL